MAGLEELRLKKYSRPPLFYRPRARGTETQGEELAPQVQKLIVKETELVSSLLSICLGPTLGLSKFLKCPETSKAESLQAGTAFWQEGEWPLGWCSAYWP